MTKIEIIQVKAETPEQRKILIEKTQNKNENLICKGSVYFEFKGELYADIYFVKGDTKIIDSQTSEKGSKSSDRNISKKNSFFANSNSHTSFKPSEEQIKRWKNQKITKEVGEEFKLNKPKAIKKIINKYKEEN